MLGVTFGNKHSYNDWGIWLEDSHKNPPLPKRYIADVPARNGLLDLTPELTPIIRFENRTLTFTFRVKAGDWSSIESMIYGDVHGKTLDVVSDLDPNWHWHGCVTVDDFSSDERTGVIVITVDAYPFKLSNTENSYTVNGNGTITCVVDRMEISPAFEIEAPTTVIYGDSSYVIESTQTTEKTLSGEIVSFADGTANPAVDLTADIEAVQDLHGYDHPWVGGAGKNLVGFTLPYTTSSSGAFSAFTTEFTLPNVGDTIRASAKCSDGTVITDAAMVFLQDSTQLLNMGLNQSYEITEARHTSLLNATRVQLYTPAIYAGKTVTEIQLERGTTPTTYEPYSNICPISGWDEVNVNVAGKNLVKNIKTAFVSPSTTYAEYTEGINGTVLVFNCVAGQSYTISGINGNRLIYAIFDSMPSSGEHSSYFENLSSGITFPKTITPQKTGVCVVAVANTQIDTSTAQIELGSTATAYEPYNGQTYTIDLDGTRYGGTLDVTTGVLTVDKGFYTFSGSESWAYASSGQYWQCAMSVITSDKYGKTLGEQICSNGIILKLVNNFYVRAYLADNSSLSADSDMNTIFANGIQNCYELATPQVVQLTSEQVMILKNQNNIWADSGEVEVTYLAQDFAGKKFYIPDLELTEGSHELTIQGTGTTTVTYTNGRL